MPFSSLPGSGIIGFLLLLFLNFFFHSHKAVVFSIFNIYFFTVVSKGRGSAMLSLSSEVFKLCLAAGGQVYVEATLQWWASTEESAHRSNFKKPIQDRKVFYEFCSSEAEILLFRLLVYFYSHQTLNLGHDSCFSSHIHFLCSLYSSFLRSSYNTQLTSVNNSVLLSFHSFIWDGGPL